MVLLGVSAALMPLSARSASMRDGAGRAFELPGAITRVFPASMPAALMLNALAPEMMPGWPRALAATEQAFLGAGSAAKPELGRLLRADGSLYLEGLLKLLPHLVLDIGLLNPLMLETASRIQEHTAIPYAVFDGRLEALPETFRQLGALLGRPSRAAELARVCEETLQACRMRLANLPKGPRPRVYYARGATGLETAGSMALATETLRFMGADLVATMSDPGLKTVSLAEVRGWNPDIIITPDRSFKARVMQDAAWQPVKAVARGRVHLAPDAPFSWLDFPASINRLPGLWWLGKVLYPSFFQEDLSAITRNLYTLFYHATPSPLRLAEILEGTT